MIKNYIKPQTFIKQVLDVLPDNPAERINAFVFGPAYSLNRYTNEDERLQMTGLSYSAVGSSATVAYENLPEGAVVDDSSVELYAENLEIKVSDDFAPGTNLARNTPFAIYDVENINKISLYHDLGGSPTTPDGSEDASVLIDTTDNTSELIAKLDGRPLQVGDYAYIEDGSETIKRQIIGFERAKVPAIIDTGTDSFVHDLIQSQTTGAGITPYSFSSNNPVFTITNVIETENTVGGVTTYSRWALSESSRYAKQNGTFAQRYIVKLDSWSYGTSDPAKVKFSISVRSVDGVFYTKINTEESDAVGNIQIALYFEGLAVTLNLDVTTPETYPVGAEAYFTVTSGKNIVNISTVLDEPANGLTIQNPFVISPKTSDYKSPVDRKFTLTFLPVVNNIQDFVFFSSSELNLRTSVRVFRAKIRVTDSAGLIAPFEVNIEKDISAAANVAEIEATEVELGSTGLKLSIMQEYLFDLKSNITTYRLPSYGERMSFDVKAESYTGKIQTVVLNGSAIYTTSSSFSPSTITESTPLILEKVYFTKAYSNKIPKNGMNDTLIWENDESGITLNPNPLLKDTSFPDEADQWRTVVATANKTKLFASYKAFLPYSITEEISLVRNVNDIETLAGKIDPENSLAYGLLWALSGAQGKPIYARRTRDGSVESFQEVLTEASIADNLYVLCPMSYDPEVHTLVSNHVTDMSKDNVKRWRIAYFGVKNPGEFIKVSKNLAETDLLGYITPISGSVNSRCNLVNIELSATDVRVGDLLRTNIVEQNDGTRVYEEFKILLVEGEDQVILEGQPSMPIHNMGMEIWASDTGRNQVEWLAKYASAFNNRRIRAVWNDGGIYNDINLGAIKQEPLYLAAEISGLRSSVVPQQGLTKTEVRSVSLCPSMYKKYTEDNLNHAAANGVFIVTQDYKGSPVYIRHQLTTETDKGSLYYEDSITVNHDAVSYGIKDIIESYIGKRNANYSTAKEMFNQMDTYLSSLTVNIANLPIGPQVAGYTDLKVEVDKNMRDTINSSVTIEYNLPLNVVRKELRAAVSQEEIIIQ